MKTKVTLPSKTIRAMARNQLKGRYWSCVAALFAASLITDGPSLVISELTSKTLPNEIAAVITEIIGFAMKLGLADFFLHVFRGLPASFDNLSGAFKHIVSVFLVEAISFFQILFRTLLLIVPGIICAVRHSMNMFVLADNPDLQPSEVIHKSWELMKGNGWKYIWLNLSFIGWEILANIPASLYSNYCLKSSGVESVPMIFGSSVQQIYQQYEEWSSLYLSSQNSFISFVLSLVSLLVTAYIMTAQAAFYDLANGSLSVETSDEENREVVDLDA